MNILKKLYIEPTSYCNLQCKMCFRNTWFDENFCELDYNVFDTLLDTIPKETEKIFFGGMGEPLHHPRILDMITKCIERNYQVELLTNGSLLSMELSSQLIDLGLHRLWISMDIIEPDTNNDLGHPLYEEMISQIRIFNKLRHQKKSKIQLGITFVATKSNVSQLGKLPLFLSKYSVDEVNISNMYPSDFETQKETLYERTVDLSIGSTTFSSNRPIVKLPYMDFHLEEVKKGFDGLMSKMNFKLHLSGQELTRKSQECPFVTEGITFIRSDGNVSPCMELLHNGTTVIGNTERKVFHHSFGSVKEQGLEDIWNSQEYKDFRERVMEFSFSPCMICGHCDLPEDNKTDCFGNETPTCGACLWAEGLLSCP